MDPFCLFRTLGLCKDPPVELTQPEWWLNLPNQSPGLPVSALDTSLRMQPHHPLHALLTRSGDAVDVRENATEIYCMQAAAASYYLPSKLHVGGGSPEQQLPPGPHSRAYAAATPPETTYPDSSRSSSDKRPTNAVLPGFFGDLPLGKGVLPCSDSTGPPPSQGGAPRKADT
ncbi:hypothetical protein Efla_001952 [Eimeria flavescens]